MNSPKKDSSDTPIHQEKSTSRPGIGDNVGKLPKTGLFERSDINQSLMLIYLSAGLFILGLITPCMTMTPHMNTPVGDLISIWKWFSDSASPQTFSIVGGVFHMIAEGDLFLATVIAGFSIIFPAYKLFTMYTICHECLAPDHTDPKKLTASVRLLAKLGKWSMLDVFVLSLIVLTFKAFPGGTTISLNVGVYAFGASVIASMFAAKALKRGLRIGDIIEVG